jgi:hypothetical protein
VSIGAQQMAARAMGKNILMSD